MHLQIHFYPCLFLSIQIQNSKIQIIVCGANSSILQIEKTKDWPTERPIVPSDAKKDQRSPRDGKHDVFTLHSKKLKQHPYNKETTTFDGMLKSR